jgi:exopolyphosphatase/guanosine-5'-triphosphate,3'-diphosphate pyrophosphatase
MDGLAIQMGADFGYTHKDFGLITQTSAENIAKLYIREGAHRNLVRKFALHLFDQLKKLHRLGNRERLLLGVAATISDIGNAISQHNHYHHSAYIMEANPLIGLSDSENTIVSEIARYHSFETPRADQVHFLHLAPQMQMTVAKLTAILRLADALDDSHQQKIHKLTVSLKNDQLSLTVHSPQNLSLEKWAFKKKSRLFKELYGIEPLLKQRRTEV